jgi:putative Ca2+/H+ antiporter (TMEM165/GDT1 family)
MKYFLIAFFAMVVAEIGDKTNILILSLTMRSKLLYVIIATFITSVVLNTVAVLSGGLIHNFVPETLIGIISGIIFILIGILILLRKENSDDIRKSSIGFFGVLGIYTLAELGDKTQITALTLSTYTGNIVAIAIGASLGMWAITVVTALLGETLSRFLNPVGLKIISGVLFIIAGISVLLLAFI